MSIKRICVEEGFLGGIDLQLPSGLVAVIGARGTGKTSLIELIRYATEAQNYGHDAAVESNSHAKSVLEGGQVSVTLSSGKEDVVVRRGAEDAEAKATGKFVAPMVFSQKEIESIGLTHEGRLSLLDSFSHGFSEIGKIEAGTMNEIRQISREIERANLKLSSSGTRDEQLSVLTKRKASLLQEAALLKEKSFAVQGKQDAIEEIGKEISQVRKTVTLYERGSTHLSDIVDVIDEELIPKIYYWDEIEGQAGFFDQFGEAYSSATSGLLKALNEYRSLLGELYEQLNHASEQREVLEDDARKLRAEVEVLSQGAGQINRNLAQVEKELAEHLDLKQEHSELRHWISKKQEERSKLMERLNATRQQRTNIREKIAEKLNRNLSPTITVKVERLSYYAPYKAAILEALRGSGLRSSDLIDILSNTVSPSELVHYVDIEDVDSLSNVAGIGKARTGRLIEALAQKGLGEIAVCNVDDTVRFELLDGTAYKDISSLSAGQRCTVILPIILQHDERVLVLDQPEDHIDNAFITKTLIKALTDRPKNSQVIVATHNANIPVLGNAAIVVHMTSDGKTGSIDLAHTLNHPETVNTISTLMEGGKEAFRRRGVFYESAD